MAQPNFDMHSARKPDHYPSASSTSTPAAISTRDAEQRYSRLIAEAEYKLLEEKARAQEREAKLRDELARERAQIPRLVQDKVDQILRERQLEQRVSGNNNNSNADGSPATFGGGGGGLEVENLRRQLSDTQRLLADMERRYQQEKRELLNLRTNQLKNETSKRGQEGDIIGRAMQVMGEYETIVRTSEEASLSRLAHHMEKFEAEWIRRSREFEERKADFETAVMTQALDVLKRHQGDVEHIGDEILRRTIGVIQEQSRSRLDVEDQVLKQAEVFKTQYKELLDKEYKDRCRQYDESLAQRERNLIKIVSAERDRIIALEREAVESAEKTHVQALQNAMKDVAKLREDLVGEHQDTQKKALDELLARREEMKLEQERIIAKANSRIQDIERQCFDAVDTAQRAVKDLHMKLAEKDAQIARTSFETQAEREREKHAVMTTVREEVESQWRMALEEIRKEHAAELEKVHDNFHERVEKEHAEQFARENELRRIHDAKVEQLEQAAEARWSKRLQESNKALERHLEIIAALREDNEQLNDQLAQLQQQMTLRENEFGSKIAALQREQEQLWHKKLEEMRQRYDKLLDEALGGPTGLTVPKVEHEKLLESLHELEERCVEMRRTESERFAKERDGINTMWRQRLDQERGERAEWEQEQLQKLAALKAELEGEARRREAENSRRLEQERVMLSEEALKRGSEHRRERETFEQRTREEHQAKLREIEDELNDAYKEKVRVLEARYHEKEVAIEKQRHSLKQEKLDFEEACKKQARDWLEKEKETILADVRRFHEQLNAEKEKLETERTQFEQDVSLRYADAFEHAKTELQKRMLDVTTLHMSYWNRCETEWLSFRTGELQLLLQMRGDHEKRTSSVAQKMIEMAQRESRETLERERAALDKREAALYQEMENSRLAYEAASRDRALRLLEERNRAQEAAEQQRVADEAKLWEELEKRVLEKEAQAETQRRILELDLRSRYEEMIAQERVRVDQLMEQHRLDARNLYEKHEVALKERDEQWHKQRLAIEAEERAAHEKVYVELRQHAEARVVEERKRFEGILRNREGDFERERSRMMDSVDNQIKENERVLKQQLATIREDYDGKTRQLQLENQSQREHYLMDLGEQERKFQTTRDEYEAESVRRFEKSLSDLRTSFERHKEEQLRREGDAHEKLERSRRQFEERLNHQYESLVEEHQKRILDLQRQSEDKMLTLEKTHQDQLIHLRTELDTSIASHIESADRRTRETSEQVRRQFQSRLDEFNTLLHDERSKRQDSEDRLRDSRDELEHLRASVEQHKLEAYRAAQAKFERIHTEMRERMRREKEETIKRQLEEEEKRLARELVRSETDTRRDAQDAVARAWDSVREGSTSGVMSSQQQQQPLSFVGVPSSAAVGASPGMNNNMSMMSSSSAAAALAARPLFSSSQADQLDPSRPHHHHHHPQQQQQQAPVSARLPASSSLPEDDRITLEVTTRRQEKLQQLWLVLDMPQTRRDQFLGAIRSLAPTQALDAVNNEIKRLEVQLPLLEVITRREFVIHRIAELERAVASRGMSSYQATQQRKQIDELNEERRQLESRLRSEIPRHESKFGGQFLFRGRPFLDILAEEDAAQPMMRK